MAGERLGSALAVRSAAPTIGRGLSVGFESVRFFGNLPNRIPERGSDLRTSTPTFRFEPLRARQLNELRARGEQRSKIQEVKYNVTQIPIERPSKAPEIFRSQTRGVLFFPNIVRPVEIRTPEKTSIPIPLEQHIHALRLRARLASARVVRPQIRTVAIPETRPISQTQASIQKSTESAVLTSTQVMPKTETGIKKATHRLVSPRASETISRNRKKTFLRPLKLIVDEEANRTRVNALVAARDRLRFSNPGQEVNNEIVVNESGVPYQKQFGSNILRKAGIDRLDGTQPRTGRDITAIKGELTTEKITAIVVNHTGVDEGDNGTEITSGQYDEVIRLPEELTPSIDPVQVLPHKKETNLNETVQITSNSPVNIILEEKISSENPEVIETTASEVTGRTPNFAESLLDRWAHNSIDDPLINIVDIRRQLVLAA